MVPINEVLGKLFEAHHVPTIAGEEWVEFPQRKMRIKGAVVEENQLEDEMTIQLDIRLEAGMRRPLVESFGGVGETSEKAVKDALRNFVTGSFHPLLAAFFDIGHDHVTQEEWSIGGRRSRAFIGDVLTRRLSFSEDKAPEGEVAVAWFDTFKEKITKRELRPGIHWVRLYLAQMKREVIECEVLLDNDVWEELQSEMRGIDWPLEDDFYSHRLFLVLRVEKGALPGAQTSVQWLADLVADWPDFTQEEIVAAVENTGADRGLATRAYFLTQVAWTQSVMAKLGVKFSPEYLCADSAGEIIETGLLAKEPYFAAAQELAPKYTGYPGFKHLVLMSADTAAIKNALRGGSNPENLVTGPTVLLLQNTTAAGMEKVNQMLRERMNVRKSKEHSPVPKSEPKPTKPWWRFWK